MKIYEIINPSDPYSLAAEDEGVAAVACMLLGQGAYALEEAETGHTACPVFLFGGDPKAWLKEKHGLDLDDVIASRRAELARVLRSVLIGKPSERAAIEKATADFGRERRHDEIRSSMNDIGRCAWKLADRLAAPAPGDGDGDGGKHKEDA